jgi:hypothetical protein
MLKKARLLMLVVFVLGLFTVAGAAFAQTEPAYDFDCNHYEEVTFPHGDAALFWMTTDPITVSTGAASQDLMNRTLIVTTEAISLSGGEINNTWGCYRTGPLSESDVVRLLNGLFYWDAEQEAYNSVNHTEVLEGDGSIATVTFTEPLPVPTATAVPTNTTVPSATPTAQPSPTTQPTEAPQEFTYLYLPVIQSVRVVDPEVTPTVAPPTPTTVPYEVGECAQVKEVKVTSAWPHAWTTTDPLTVSVAGQNYPLGQRTLIESESSYTLSTATNTWSCYYRGELPMSERTKLLDSIAPALHMRIASNGTVTMLSSISVTPTATPQPPTP